MGLPWASLPAFLRIVTNPRVFEHPEPIGAAWTQVQAWLENDLLWVPHPTERHRDVLGTLLAEPGVQAGLVADADIAALALEHGLAVCSTDGDFGRFRDLNWINPLVQPSR